jgi:hypothetical protein
MRFSIVEKTAVIKSGVLNADPFLKSLSNHAEAEFEGQLVALGDLVSARKESIDPHTIKEDTVIYIGLENIESCTGRIIGETTVNPKSIKSRSKVFHKNDILFSKLRPGLNKIAFVNDLTTGICSGEIYVLTPKKNVSGLVLAFTLRLPAVKMEAEKLVAGAALPRLDLEKVLNLRVPLISNAQMTSLNASLSSILAGYQKARELADRMYLTIEQDFSVWLGSNREDDCSFADTKDQVGNAVSTFTSLLKE